MFSAGESDAHGLQPDGPASQVVDHGGAGDPGLQAVPDPGPGELRHLLQVELGDSVDKS